jgi:hypothetical protein
VGTRQDVGNAVGKDKIRCGKGGRRVCEIVARSTVVMAEVADGR